ncbi:MAG: sodium:proton antiporter [Anaerolineae bacterium]|nr:sodium:proton antiporter [Anaerolineae bacterium]
MENDLLIGITLVVGLGMLGQWVAWRVRLPSIIFLLLIGLLVGPFAALVLESPILDVENFLGDLLFPIVSASIAVILFEGGLSLRFSDIRGSSMVVGNLVTIGALLTWLLSAVAAYFLFDVSISMALLIGATLVVTGPTVVIPLLKQIRPKGRVASILRWEGIVIDPIGAVLAVLVFEEILSSSTFFASIWILAKTAIIGLVIGWLVAQLMVELYRRLWVPNALQNPVTLGIVIASFTLSNVLQAESGLLTVTVMGIAMANQKRFDIRHIVEFKETLQVMLLSSLFILLSARMQPSDFQQIGWSTLVFVLLLLFVFRPLAIYISTVGSKLTWQERVFLAWMAPRGIVAASVASIFAIELIDHGNTEATILVPVTFAVIIGTVMTYSLTAGLLAQWLRVSEKNPQGLLIIGATPWVRAIAKEVKNAGFRVLLADSNPRYVDRAHEEQLEIYHGNILSEMAEDEINFGGLGRLLAMTSNTEVNALAGEHYRSTFELDSIYELQRFARSERDDMSQHLGGRPLFPRPATYEVLNQRFQSGARILTVTIDDVGAAMKNIPDVLLPFFVIPDEERLVIWTVDNPPKLQSGHRVIALVESEFYDDLLEQKAIKSRQGDFDTRVFPQLLTD